MTYTRPDLCYATKELARSLQQPTAHSQKTAKHLLRYLKGTQHYKFVIQPTVRLANSDSELNLDVFVDADWAGCPITRRSTTGFVIRFLGSTINFGSRTQATVALSSAESELYAINTGATEGLHAKNFILESGLADKLNMRIHTDSSSGKSIATRVGASKKAKRIDRKHLFIQQLVHQGILVILKIGTHDNIADILTKYVSAETLMRRLYNAGLLGHH